MQTLKDDIRNRILIAALTEFGEFGYSNSSMRRIASSAGITTGNIYRYFRNKDDLFRELLHPTYEKFVEYTLNIKEEIEKTYTRDATEVFQYIRMVDETVVELLKDSSTEVKILLVLSDDSSYEGLRLDLVAIIKQILEKVFQTSKDCITLPSSDLLTIQMYATMIIEGICLILRDHKDGHTIKFLVDELIFVYSVGIAEKLRK
ncbi:TetR/AcrR family transcriptional regulator [Bacillus sp. DJP31]|uniref:TetR/AcrR family transcriptional regulator n=1 Tax=Bacillus sp. DJP31 TaxID=3409789 RepID=UPI003BB531B2